MTYSDFWRTSHLNKATWYCMLRYWIRAKVKERTVSVCVGLAASRTAKGELACLYWLHALTHFDKIPGTMYIFDPVMTELDIELCKLHEIEIIAENEDGKRLADKPTLFYMPHCGRGLYSNTLSANWNKQHLPNVTIIGNRFDMYVGRWVQLLHSNREMCFWSLALVNWKRTLRESVHISSLLLIFWTLCCFPKSLTTTRSLAISPSRRFQKKQWTNRSLISGWVQYHNRMHSCHCEIKDQEIYTHLLNEFIMRYPLNHPQPQ